MCCISAGGGYFISPTPINYLHVKHIDPLLMPASELSGGRVGESDAQSGVELRGSYLDFMHWQER